MNIQKHSTVQCVYSVQTGSHEDPIENLGQTKILTILAKPQSEPISNLNQRHKADPKAKSTYPAEARDEVQPGHFWRSLEFWNISVISVVSVKWYCGTVASKDQGLTFYLTKCC